ncbi:MAG: oxygenase MpaB family protein, partial [Bdellovibrionota bacterium]
TVVGEIPERIGRYEAGHAYHANEQEVLVWVWATIIKPVKEIYEWLHRPLTPEETRRYYEECKLFSLYFGIDLELLPPTWETFTKYFDDYVQSGDLRLSDIFRAKQKQTAGNPLLRSPASKAASTWFLSLQMGLLPEKVRQEYATGIPYGRFEKALYGASIPGLRAAWRRVPEDLRYWPAYRAAMRRVGAEGRPGILGRWMARQLPPPFGDKKAPAISVSLRGLEPVAA